MKNLFNLKIVLLLAFLLIALFIFSLVLFFSLDTKTMSPTASQNPTPTIEPTQKEKALQETIDANTSEGTKKFYDENAWANYIPASAEDYFIGYDNNKKGFFAYLYPKTSSNIPIDTQVVGIKSEVLSFLTKINADTDNIEWVVSPK